MRHGTSPKNGCRRPALHGHGGAVRMAAAALLAVLGAPAAMAQAGRTLPLSDFERGVAGWVTNDAIKYSGKTQDTPLVSVVRSEEAHSGTGSLQISFHPGQGWAGAYIPLAAVRDEWADAGVDELAFWMKGDGQDKGLT